MKQKQLLTLEESRLMLNVSRNTFLLIRKEDKTFPKPVMILKSQRYRRVDLDKWLNKKES